MAEAGTVRLYWSVPADESFSGFEIRRDAGHGGVTITDAPIAPCHTCEFRDASPPDAQVLKYTLVALRPGGLREEFLLGQVDGTGLLPACLQFQRPAPNPMRGPIDLVFGLPANSHAATLEIFDSAGRRRAVLFEGPAEAGWHSVHWVPRQAERLESGVYWLRLRSGAQQAGRKILVLE